MSTVDSKAKDSNVIEHLKCLGQTDLQRYIFDHSLRLNQHQAKIVEYTLKQTQKIMLGALDCAQHYQIILKAMGAKKCIEIGTFTGATTLSIALALPEDGKIVTLDITDELVAKDIWEEAGIEHKIDLRVGAAINAMDKMISDGEAGTYDFVFIDADKPNYKHYYERALVLVRKGGLIAIDNVLWFGKVLDENVNDESTLAFKNLNKFIKEDQRVDISMLAIGDGVTFCLKK